jgi:hypothetical protein
MSELLSFKVKGSRIAAISEASGGWSVMEDVPDVAVAAAAADLPSLREGIELGLDREVFGANRSGKARPAGPRVKFIFRAKEGKIATRAAVNSRLVVVPVGVLERGLGPPFAQDFILFFGEPFFPLFVGEDQFFAIEPILRCANEEKGK